ncbi:MAG: hypothetical protein ACO1OG_10105 [Devosia sp.]
MMIVVSVFGALLAGQAAAATLNYTFSGAVDVIFTTPNAVFTDVAYGDTMSYTVSVYDVPTSGTAALAEYSILGGTWQVSSYGGTFGPSSGSLYQAADNDFIIFSASSNDGSVGSRSMDFTSVLLFAPMSLFDSALVLPPSIDPSTFTLPRYMEFILNPFVQLRATVTSISVNVAAVPVPAGLSLLAAGVGMMGLLGLRKRRAARLAPVH